MGLDTAGRGARDGDVAGPARAMVASRGELDAFLAEHPEIAFFDVLFTGMSGVPRGKRLRRHEMAGVYDYGRFLPGSILVVDITGQDCAETGLVWGDGDADRRGRPAPGHLAPAPWLGPDVGQALLSLYELDGTPNDLDPRHVLAGVLDRFAADGLTPVVAVELEFYLVEAAPARDGHVRLPRARVGGERARQHAVYGLPEIEDAAPFLRALWAACDVQTIPLEGVISEYAPGQLELTLKHRADALRAADEAVLYKRAAKGVARAQGMAATFMAKPFAEQAGSGMHLHISFNDADGRNLCAGDDGQASALLRHAIGGMRALMADSFAILAPNANSYRRFRANSYAPTSPTWGVNNRTVSLRIPAGSSASRHVEHRVAGADANPYLALAAVLAAAHHGITHQIDPGPAVVGDGYAAEPDADTAHAAPAPPAHWFAAVDRFESSEVLKAYLGERFVRMFSIVKRTEQARFFDQVTPADVDWCLHNA